MIKNKKLILKEEKKKNKRLFKLQWSNIRNKTLLRDNYICQICKKNLKLMDSRAVAIHHIIPRQYKELFFDENNLISLCSYCHKWGKCSPHQNALYFTDWLQKNRYEQYQYLLKYLQNDKKI